MDLPIQSGAEINEAGPADIYLALLYVAYIQSGWRWRAKSKRNGLYVGNDASFMLYEMFNFFLLLKLRSYF